MIIYILFAIVLIHAVIAACYVLYYKSAEYIGVFELRYTVDVLRMRHGCKVFLFKTRYKNKPLCVTISEEEYYRLLLEHSDKTAVKIRFLKPTKQFDICILDNNFEVKDTKSILKGFLFSTIAFGFFAVCVYYQL